MTDRSMPGLLALVVPNALTGLRLAVALAFPWIDAGWRLEAVLVAGATDAVDGLLARRLGAITWFGALLDGVADKAFAVIGLVVLTADGGVPRWSLAPLLARDVVVAMIYLYVAARRRWSMFRGVSARWPGKATTFLLVALMVAVLGWPGAVPWLMYPAMACSIGAAADYLVVLVRALRANAAPRRARDAA